MAHIYVREQGAIIRKHGSRLIVEKEEEALAEIFLHQITGITVFGNVQVTTQALSELLDRGIPLALCTRNGRPKGHLLPELSAHIELRVAQYRSAADPAATLQVAKLLVEAKLRNSAALLAAFRANYPSTALKESELFLRAMAGRAAGADAIETLLGIEGAGAAEYFSAVPLINRSGLPFPGRRKHPATDPLNALLSFGYTLVMQELRGLAASAGLEPYLGFLHSLDPTRPSLALDLLEPFRSIAADRLALTLVNEKSLTAADFATRAAGPGAGGVILTPEALPRFLAAYEDLISAPRAAAPKGLRAELSAQVESLVQFLRANGPFEPFWEDRPCST